MYKSVGIQIDFIPSGRFVAHFDAKDYAPFPSGLDLSLSTSYEVGDLAPALALLIRAASQCDVSFDMLDGHAAWLFVDGDGEDPDVYLPDNWREILADAAKEIGFVSAYDELGMSEAHGV